MADLGYFTEVDYARLMSDNNLKADECQFTVKSGDQDSKIIMSVSIEALPRALKVMKRLLETYEDINGHNISDGRSVQRFADVVERRFNSVIRDKAMFDDDEMVKIEFVFHKVITNYGTHLQCTSSVLPKGRSLTEYKQFL